MVHQLTVLGGHHTNSQIKIKVHAGEGQVSMYASEQEDIVMIST